MKACLIVILVLFGLSCIVSHHNQPVIKQAVLGQTEHKIIHNRVLVQFRNSNNILIDANVKHPVVPDSIRPGEIVDISYLGDLTPNTVSITFNRNINKNEFEHISNSHDVELVEYETEFEITGERVPEFMEELQWGLKRINTLHAWDWSNLSEEYIMGKGNVIVAVLDTGLDITHEEFKNDPRISLQSVVSVSANDDHGHGTHVSGIIGAGLNKVGISGITPFVQLVSIKVLEKGRGTTSTIIKGMEKARQLALGSGKRCVINMSLGSYSSSPIFKTAINNAIDSGLIIVAAAGNSGINAQYFEPAGVRDVVCVGASTRKIKNGSVELNSNCDYKTFFSNWGYKIDVIAPGYNILSSVPGNNEYEQWSGTSMSAPHVTGIVASILSYAQSKGKSLSQWEIRSVIRLTADDVTAIESCEMYDGNIVKHGVDAVTGYGVANHLAAIQFVDKNIRNIPFIRIKAPQFIRVKDKTSIPIESAHINNLTASYKHGMFPTEKNSAWSNLNLAIKNGALELNHSQFGKDGFYQIQVSGLYTDSDGKSFQLSEFLGIYISGAKGVFPVDVESIGIQGILSKHVADLDGNGADDVFLQIINQDSLSTRSTYDKDILFKLISSENNFEPRVIRISFEEDTGADEDSFISSLTSYKLFDADGDRKMEIILPVIGSKKLLIYKLEGSFIKTIELPYIIEHSSYIVAVNASEFLLITTNGETRNSNAKVFEKLIHLKFINYSSVVIKDASEIIQGVNFQSLVYVTSKNNLLVKSESGDTIKLKLCSLATTECKETSIKHMFNESTPINNRIVNSATNAVELDGDEKEEVAITVYETVESHSADQDLRYLYTTYIVDEQQSSLVILPGWINNPLQFTHYSGSHNNIAFSDTNGDFIPELVYAKASHITKPIVEGVNYRYDTIIESIDIKSKKILWSCPISNDLGQFSKTGSFVIGDIDSNRKIDIIFDQHQSTLLRLEVGSSTAEMTGGYTMFNSIMVQNMDIDGDKQQELILLDRLFNNPTGDSFLVAPLTTPLTLYKLER